MFDTDRMNDEDLQELLTVSTKDAIDLKERADVLSAQAQALLRDVHVLRTRASKTATECQKLERELEIRRMNDAGSNSV